MNLRNKILDRINILDKFPNFEYIKSQKSFRKKTDFGFYNIELYMYDGYDLERNEMALEVYPVYGVRFDKLMKWYEGISFKSLADQRNNYTVGTDGEMLDKTNKFYFLYSENKFDNDFKHFIESVEMVSNLFFSKYRSICDFYCCDVLPKLNYEDSLPNEGADWIFEYLAAVKLCDPSKFDSMVEMLEIQIEKMKSRRNPNIIEYENKFSSIFENLKLSSL